MKKIIHILLSLIFVSLVSCADDDNWLDVNAVGDIDQEFVSALKSGNQSISITCDDWVIYRKSNPEDEWAIVNSWQDYEDDGNFMLLDITFKDGKIWLEESLWTYSGPGPYLTVWEAYCKKTGENRKLCYAYDYEIDTVNRTLSFDEYEYPIVYFTKSRIVLSSFSNILSSDGTLHYIRKTITKYSLSTPQDFSTKDYLCFDNRYNLYKYISTKVREVFGQYVQTPYGVVDLDVADEWLNSIKGKATTGAQQ